MRHGRVTTFTQQGDELVRIETKGYYDVLNTIKIEMRQNLPITQQTVLADVIRALEVFTTTDCPELTITLHKDKHNQPQRMVKTWTESKQRL